MARLVEWHDDHSWDAERVRFRSAIRRRGFREWLRRIACRCQRPVLVRSAKEKILKRRLGSGADDRAFHDFVWRRTATSRSRFNAGNILTEDRLLACPGR